MLTRDEERFFEAEQSFHEAKYLSGENPRQQSGFGRDERDRERFRRPIAAAIERRGAVSTRKASYCIGVVAWSLGALPVLGSATPVRQIPFTWTPGQIELPVSVNGAEPVTFLLDTGAEYSVVSTALAAKLGIATTRRGVRDFATGVTLSFGGIKLSNQEVMVMPFDSYRKRGRAIEGLIGYDFFARYIVRIDFHACSLAIWEPSSFRRPPNTRTLPVRFVGRLPTIRVEISFPGRKAVTAHVMVDTGASQTLILRHPFANARRLLQLATDETIAGSLASGDVRLVRLPARRLAVAGWEFDRPLVKAFREATGSGAFTESDGVIGNEVLRRFHVTIDYLRQTLGLEPNSALREPFVR